MFNSYRMKQARLAQSMTQKELGLLVGLTASGVGMYEQNRRLPDADTTTKIAWALGVSLDWLCGNSDDAVSDNQPDSLEALLQDCCLRILDQQRPLTYRGLLLSMDHRMMAAALIHNNLFRHLQRQLPQKTDRA
ncbi:MAG: helix-turn-helix transcriptional regulator [Clostridia bacterium]|nr:helix-turn-helix transcriptional regulator [Oscillospiraceae bacterium]MBQ4623194.1 helix-turn-helix transcriptional regulator [Clostridia bacterium]MBQ6990012.1 helix-turn-helix transcriptional regulator [Clostridia bacterium]